MYRNILIATDGSELATRALDHAIALAKDVGAQLTVVTVSEMGPAMDMVRQHAAQGSDSEAQFEAAVLAAAQRVLDAAARKADVAGVSCVTVHIPDRHPADAIVEAARERGADLIVMASHGRRGFNRILLGSQTIEVLTHSKVPTLVVR